MRDLRNSLPTNAEAEYDTRPLDAITGVTLHYTEGPASQAAEEAASNSYVNPGDRGDPAR